MICGIGIDLAHIQEFVRILADPATHFLGAHFTPGELAYARAQESDDPARHLAARYAAKEAVIKALRTQDAVRRTGVNSEHSEREGEAPRALPVEGASSGFAAARSKTEGFAESTTRAPVIDYREIEVVSCANGAPTLRFHGAVAEAIRCAGVRNAHLSLSHDGDLAIAMVVLEI